ncbi:BnaCnng62960D [Brassica napus]|uniref:BnaCnng62960D protein n=1 Tax=Brassica napus TaxID=3708 RepID=A0A078JP42_BRANA|nr:BnaCnng62960D [Brassica napus]
MQPIFNAIIQNDIPAFLGLVEEKESWLEERNVDQDNSTVLHMAAKHGHGELVSKIIELKPSLIFSRNAHGNTPLHLAALLGDVNTVRTLLEFGSETCSARNNNCQTPLHLVCRSISTESARLFAEKTHSVSLDELKFSISSGSTFVTRIVLERFPYLARELAWVVEDSLTTLLHHACDRGNLELISILLGLDQGLEKARNTNGLSPLHLAVLRGPVVVLEEFLEKAPLSFSSLTRSKETVFHLAARNKNVDAFIFMAERLSINNQKLMREVDVNGNTVLHIAVSMSCGARLLRYIVGKKIIDINYKNNMGFTAFDLLTQEGEDFELLSTSTLLRLDTKLDSDQTIEKQDEHSNPYNKRSQEGVIRLLRLIETNTSNIAHIKRNKKGAVERGRRSLEREMHIEALQNARNTIAIVAVLIASVSYAGGINPPGGVYDDGPWRGKSMAGNTAAFKVFAICNNIALFTSLCIVILLVSIIPYKRKPLKRLLVATHRMMWVSVGFMATAYVAASWVTIPHFHQTKWLFPAIVSVAGGSLVVLFSYLGVETIGHWFKKMNRVRDIPPIASTSPDHPNVPSFARTNSDLAASEKSGYFTY